MKSITGIDDIGTMGSECEGWSYFTISSSLKDEFIIKSKEILVRSKLNSFHGKDFKRKKSKFYIEFFQLIKETLTKADETLLVCIISSQSWKDEYLGFCTKLINKSYSDVDFDLDALIETSSKLSAPIFTFMNLTNHFTKTKNTDIEIDKDSILKKYPGLTIQALGVTIDGELVFNAALNAYRKKQFPNSPAVSGNNIAILNDEESFMIQAADMFGNFSLAYASHCLGCSSKTKKLKSEIFTEVFDELVSPERINNLLSIENGQIALKTDGAFAVKIGSKIA